TRSRPLSRSSRTFVSDRIPPRASQAQGVSNEEERGGKHENEKFGVQNENRKTAERGEKDGDPQLKNDRTDAEDASVPRSRYAREVERRERSWKALNEEKEKFGLEQKRLASERQQFEEERTAALAVAPQYSVAQYEQAA